MTHKKAVIIGGGMGGLAMGSYLQMNGYETSILEKNRECSGVSAAWRRKGYLFDGATNWLVGSSDGEPLAHAIMSEIFDFSRLSIWDFEEFVRIEDGDSELRVYTDIDRFEDELCRKAPEDLKTIRRYTNAVREFSELRIPHDQARDLLTFGQTLAFPFKNLRLLRFYSRWRGVTIREFAERFKNPALRSMFQQILPHHNFFSMIGAIAPLGWMTVKSGGWPRGGTERFFAAAVERYEKLGGRIHYGAEASAIETRGDRVCGVRTTDNNVHEGDIVVSAADRHHTLTELVEPRFVTKNLLDPFRSLDPFPAILQISAGVAREFPGEPARMVMPLQAPIQMGDECVDRTLLRICNFDPCFAPEGKTPLIAHLRTHDWRYWHELRCNDPKAYRVEKSRIAEQVLDSLDARFGGVRERLEALDVATPATYMRYTNIWRGSYQSFAPTPRGLGYTLSRRIRGLEGFYFAGQWLWSGGGLTRAVSTSRQTAQAICRDDNKPFTAQPAG